MTAAAAIGAAMLAGLLLAGLVFLRTRPSVMLGHLERQLSALRQDIADLRAAQDHHAASLERRMAGLEQVSAGAAVEARIVSEVVLAFNDSSSSDGDDLQPSLDQQRKDTSFDLRRRVALPPCAAAPLGCVGSPWGLPCWVDAPGALDLLTTSEPTDQ